MVFTHSPPDAMASHPVPHNTTAPGTPDPRTVAFPSGAIDHFLVGEPLQTTKSLTRSNEYGMQSLDY